MKSNIDILLDQMYALRNEKNIAGMARFKIDISTALGIPLPVIRSLGKPYKNDHELALTLWQTGIHEARIMATLIDNPLKVTREQIELWSRDFKFWDLCDQACLHLFCKGELAVETVFKYSRHKSEFQKRMAFVLMAALSLKKINASTEVVASFLPIIVRESDDARIYVKKAVNWALRQIGKKNEVLRLQALQTCEQIQSLNSKSGNWISKDAMKELKKRSYNY